MKPSAPSRRIAARARGRALQRGTLVHRLLQSLPDLPADRRRAAAPRYLARNADGWSEGDREALMASVLALVGDPALCCGCSRPGSRAEVSIVGGLERPGGRRPWFPAKSTGWW